MKSRVLIAYATRAGSSGDVAQALAEVLGARGFAVDVRTIKSRPAVGGYQAAILGSAVRMGEWLPEAVSFAAEHQVELRRLPVALFTVHILNTGADLQSVTKRRAYAAGVRRLISPVGEAFFSGVVNPASLSMIDRLMVRAVKPPVGDLRDWERIRGWAGQVLAEALPHEKRP
jgi:menaquinone-dependent protoporphyrinogen oxidase